MVQYYQVELSTKQQSVGGVMKKVDCWKEEQNLPDCLFINNFNYSITEYQPLFHSSSSPSRGKSLLLSCKINNIECVAKRVKQKEQVNSILSLYLPSRCCQHQHDSEYCFSLKGKCLGSMFRDHGQIDQMNIIQFLSDMLCTLELLENQNLTHNDIKPDNIVQYGDHWYLIDYELCKPFRLKRGKYFDSNNGQLRCERFSRGYRSPERIKSKLISPKSDLYSLGLVVLEVVMGRRLSGLEDPQNVHQYLQQAQHRYCCSSTTVGKQQIMLSIIVHDILPLMLEKSCSRRVTPSSLLFNHVFNSSLEPPLMDQLNISETYQFYQNVDYFLDMYFPAIEISLVDS